MSRKSGPYVCGLCGSLDEAAFYLSCRTRCRPCAQAKTDPEQRKAYMREYRRLHPDAFRSWHLKNKEHRFDYMQRWSAGREKEKALNYAAWAKANKHIVNALIAKRMAVKRRALPAWANHVAMKAIYREAARLTRETGIRHEVDHIYPLQGRTVCGLHYESNLQILTKTDNIRKGNKMPSVAA